MVEKMHAATALIGIVTIMLHTVAYVIRRYL